MSENGTTTATVLVTDLVGSTSHRTHLGEVEADRVRRVPEQNLRLVTSPAGRVVETGGDGIRAASRSAEVSPR